MILGQGTYINELKKEIQQTKPEGWETKTQDCVRIEIRSKAPLTFWRGARTLTFLTG